MSAYARQFNINVTVLDAEQSLKMNWDFENMRLPAGRLKILCLEKSSLSMAALSLVIWRN